MGGSSDIIVVYTRWREFLKFGIRSFTAVRFFTSFNTRLVARALLEHRFPQILPASQTSGFLPLVDC